MGKGHGQSMGWNVGARQNQAMGLGFVPASVGFGATELLVVQRAMAEIQCPRGAPHDPLIAAVPRALFRAGICAVHDANCLHYPKETTFVSFPLKDGAPD